MLLLRRLLEKFHTFSLARWTRILSFLGLHVRENGEVCSVDASVFFARTWKSEHYFYEVNDSGSVCDDGGFFLLLSAAQ